MKILELLPELEEGGVERHVVALATGMNQRRHKICVVSRGGKLALTLPESVFHRQLPVHSKNPAVILYCSLRIAAMVKREGFQLVHAHSRVPAWIGFLASRKAGIPLVVTAHFLSGNRSRWIYIPYRKAVRVICVSRAVEQEMAGCFSGNTTVVRNGLAPPSTRWQGPSTNEEIINLLFIGRLTHSKGLQDIIPALAGIRTTKKWRLDILGDGPLRSELEKLADVNGVADRIFFHGFNDDTDRWLVNCSCLLFPSHHEGMPLTLARAIQLFTPIIASDILAVRELCSRSESLIAPGDMSKWRDALENFINTGRDLGGFNPNTIPTLEEMAVETEKVYHRVLSSIVTPR